jgi:hypothetical protein
MTHSDSEIVAYKLTVFSEEDRSLTARQECTSTLRILFLPAYATGRLTQNSLCTNFMEMIIFEVDLYHTNN